MYMKSLMPARERPSEGAWTNARAVERVLAAERGVERGLSEAREEAAKIVAAARARGVQIRQRAEDRVTRLHVAMEAKIALGIEHLRRQSLESDDDSARNLHVGVGRAALQRAVDRLAAQITGDDRGGDR